MRIFSYTKNKACPNCMIATRREKLTGATYTLTVFSEHEECRTCLDPGLLRRCCGNYYCDECFYSSPACRSCNTPIGDKKQDALIMASITSVALSWAVTFTVSAAILAMVIIVSVNEARIPHTLYGYECYGFFRTCDLPVCIDVNRSVALGHDSLPPLTTFTPCTLNSSYKLQSQACIFDSQLYHSTHSAFGYDICSSSFQQGTYIFEDTFEYWTNPLDYTSNLMSSAAWADIVNGHASDACGLSGDPNGGKYALVFSGSQQRYAVTQDFDVHTGGWLEMDLFLAPIGYEASHPYCQVRHTYDCVWICTYIHL